MPCFNPVKCWIFKENSGKIRYFYSTKNINVPLNLLEQGELPCGKCQYCRQMRAREWAQRCMNESKYHEKNCFITLTYDNEHLPENSSLIKKDLQDFFKRLRKYLSTKEAGDSKIKYYACGEYGGNTDRPHYHALIFGYDFEDKEIRVNKHGQQRHHSETLVKIWQKGSIVDVGTVTFDSANYVAGYIHKKIFGKDADSYYGNRLPEFNLMSKGIGKQYYEEYKEEMFPSGYCVINGVKTNPPKYYQKLFKGNNKENELAYYSARKSRKKKQHYSSDRLKQKEEYANLIHKQNRNKITEE